jgi:CheY-like chemotaxis protein/HPt (histidine-containing phosphotransfer) domain-containing protein
VMVAAGRASPEVFHRGAAQDLSNERTPPPSIADARAQGRLILIAEDDEVNQKVILQQLGLLGYAAELAANGTEALRLWRNGRYALLLTDLHMPEMDGYGLAQTIRLEEAGRWRTPILALTANALQGEANHALAAGIDEYLTKPMRLAALQAALETWLPAANAATPPAIPLETSSGPAGRVVDVTVLKGLIGDDPKFVQELLRDYLASARGLASELRTACDGGDARQVGAIAHKLKSSSRWVGALALGDHCAELENAGRAADKAAIAHCMEQFDAALAQVEADIAGLLAESQL